MITLVEKENQIPLNKSAKIYKNITDHKIWRMKIDSDFMIFLDIFLDSFIGNFVWIEYLKNDLISNRRMFSRDFS